MLDPILVNTFTGHDQVNGPRRVKAHSEQSVQGRDFEDPEIAEQLRRSRNGCERNGSSPYKKRSTHKEMTR